MEYLVTLTKESQLGSFLDANARINDEFPYANCRRRLHRRKVLLINDASHIFFLFRDRPTLCTFYVAHENITDFGAALTGDVVTNNTLELANDSLFLGSPDLGSKVFIRPCFTELPEILLGRCLKECGCYRLTRNRHICVQFCSPVPVALQGKTVVFEERRRWYRFGHEGVM